MLLIPLIQENDVCVFQEKSMNLQLKYPFKKVLET